MSSGCRGRAVQGTDRVQSVRLVINANSSLSSLSVSGCILPTFGGPLVTMWCVTSCWVSACIAVGRVISRYCFDSSWNGWSKLTVVMLWISAINTSPVVDEECEVSQEIRTDYPKPKSSTAPKSKSSSDLLRWKCLYFRTVCSMKDERYRFRDLVLW